MKRKIICVTLALTLSLFTGCTSSSSKTAPSNEQEGQKTTDMQTGTKIESEHAEDENSSDTGTSSDANTPSDDTSSEINTETKANNNESFRDMEKALDSLMLSVLELDCDYTMDEPFFFWTAVYYGIVNYTDEIPQAKLSYDEIQVPRSTLEEFATGLFASCKELPTLPPELSIITYDEESDSYFFIPSDRGNISTSILKATKNSDGSVDLTVAMYNLDTNESICCYDFTLMKNPDAQNSDQVLFQYLISSMKPSDSITEGSKLTTLTGTYQGFSDSHTVEFYVDGNLNAFQIYSTELISILSKWKEDAELSFSVETDTLTGSRTIVNIITK